MSKVYYELDESTGEILPTEDTLVALQQGDIVRRKKQIETSRIMYEAKNDNGNFIWLVFTYGEELFPNLSAANLTRLMYAATFCNSKGKIMEKKKLQEKMKLNRSRWSEFWTEVTENDILFEENKIVYANSKYIVNGHMNTEANYTRLFCEYVRQLYENCESTSFHKTLSYIFKIIPFVNRRTNIVCYNPSEQDEDDIRTMRLGDFCEAIGYEAKNARRLARELLKIRINGELPIGFFVTSMDEKDWIIVTNPKLYFGGKYDPVFKKYRDLFIQEAKEFESGIRNGISD